MIQEICIINGPNLNLLGRRETSIYGDQSFESYFNSLKSHNHSINLEYFQTNHEGAIIDKLHSIGFDLNKACILNAGAYTHTSIALADAIKAIEIPVVEVHISNVMEREYFRKFSYVKPVCIYTISGKGLAGYQEAIDFLTQH